MDNSTTNGLPALPALPAIKDPFTGLDIQGEISGLMQDPAGEIGRELGVMGGNVLKGVGSAALSGASAATDGWLGTRGVTVVVGLILIMGGVFALATSGRSGSGGVTGTGGLALRGGATAVSLA